MTGKATWIAPSNIAFVKYWGTRNRRRVLPYNPSISMSLDCSVSRSTVELREADGQDEVLWRDAQGEMAPAPPAFAEPVRAHLQRLRRWAERRGSCRVATENSFPTGAGMASSASGFAALTLATVAALGKEASLAELSRLARLSGSGSAARSVLGGYVEWPAGEGAGEGHAVALAPAGHWHLADVVAVVDSRPKAVSSREGHARVLSSPYFRPRLRQLPERLERVRRAIAERAFGELAEVVEEEAIDLHLMAMSSRPPVFYWRPATVAVLEEVRRLRAEGLEICATMDAGPNVHMICSEQSAAEAAAIVGRVPGVEEIIQDRVGDGPRQTEEHLF